MRKLSCKWPLWLTLFAFAQPVFYVFFRIGKPQIFNTSELAEKILAAVVLTILIWFIYGIACLLTSPLRDTSDEKPWKPNENFHIEVNKDKGEDGRQSEGDQSQKEEKSK